MAGGAARHRPARSETRKKGKGAGLWPPQNSCARRCWGRLYSRANGCFPACRTSTPWRCFLLYTVCLGARSALAATAVDVMLEGLFYGFGDWWLAYCWAWRCGCWPCTPCAKNDSALLWAVAGFFRPSVRGAVPAGLFGGVWPAGRWRAFVSGIPFSVAHCAGNFVIVLALYHPLKRVCPACGRVREAKSTKGACGKAARALFLPAISRGRPGRYCICSGWCQCRGCWHTGLSAVRDGLPAALPGCPCAFKP